jgi:hypothetical protein
MTRETIEQALAEIRRLAEADDHESAHCAELAMHAAFIDHVAALDIDDPSRYVLVHRLRELARLMRSSREIVFRRGA